ncbi:MAG: RluA family pseudouridine synthase [Muribaculaceae bacterium]|nr:RluA family pseudouridine synthase [Muribaculaceae bacterium]
MNKERNRGAFTPDKIAMRVNRAGEEVRLIDFLEQTFADAKRNDIKKWLKYGHVKADGQVTSAFDYPLAPGAEVELNFSRPFVTFHHHRLELVYEDDDIIVVNKGYGLLSVGTGAPSTGKPGKPQETAYNILKDYVKAKNPANKIFVVHRLDRHTSGLMMFAKSAEMQEAMQHNWNNMVISRKYVALVEGIVEQDEGEIRSMLEENSAFKVYSSKEGTGKMAVTRYKVLRRFQGNTLVEFELDTGRKNQIRVHASDMGHPIVGDVKYGGHVSRLHRLALHAQTLRFAHPRTRRDMHFVSDIPW